MPALFHLGFEIEGEQQVSRALLASEDALEDLGPAFRVIGERVQAAAREQFETQGSRGGERWTKLSDDYREWKDRHFPGRPILVRQGGMKGAVLDPSAIHASRHRMIFEPRNGYLAAHQAGKGRLPQRRVVQLTAGDRRQWERIVLTWIRHQQGRAAWPPVL